MQQTININCLSTLKNKPQKIKHNKQCRDNDVSAETLIFNLDQPNKSYITRNKTKYIRKKKHDKRASIQKTKELDFPQTGAIFERSLRMYLISVFPESGFLARTATVARLTMSRPLRT